LIQLNGDVKCSAVPSETPVNLADRDHFKRAVAERRFVAGSYVFGRVIKKHTINLTYPIIDESGRLVAVLFAALDLVSLDRFIAGINLPPGSILVTADAEGNIISRRPDPAKWFGRKVSPQMMAHMSQTDPEPVVLSGPDGIERLHTFSHVGTPDTSGYTLTIGIPREDIVAAAQYDQNIGLVALAVTTLLALLATWLVGNLTIVKRVAALVKTSQRIAAGDLQARSGIGYGREEIGALAKALDEMAYSLQRKEIDRDLAEERLRAADHRKDQFLAMLAHELRNPLAPISAAAQVILMVKGGDEPRLRQASEIIIRQVAHMAGLVDDLIDVARVTRGLITTEKKPQEIKLIVGDAVEQVRPLIKTRRHHLVVDIPPQNAFVLGDHKRLVQIVANVLHNAAKYTREGGNIVLQLRVDNDEAIISITDDGIGISADLLPYVFDLFTQAERTADRSQGGLGIGLALVKSIVGLHGGTVTAHSDGPGTGSKFVIRLPTISHGRQIDEEQSTAPPRPGHVLRILVVDDNVDAANILAMFLESEGHELAVEHTSRRALERARIEAPDVCLLDIGLPDLDGYELARQLRAQTETAHALLIAVTGYDRKQDLSARSAVFDHYFVKPIDTAKLIELLAEFTPPEKQMPDQVA
jgi:signal transduction histidine kinase/CheY-like chemotaxis protein